MSVVEPPFSPGDAQARLRRIRRLAWLMDAAVRVPGTRLRFGLSGVLGLPPAAGDAAMAAISLYIVYEAYRLGVPRAVLAKMLGNVAIEAAVGSVPVAGDLFDIGFKANLRNISLIDKHLEDRP